MALLTLPAFAAEKQPDGEGFLRHWLILAPISMAAGQAGEEALNKEWIAGEAKLAPKAGEKVKVGDKELTWKAHEAGDYY